ncbi:zona pellucida sperm-binding protein 4-like isoform X2 [Boleophthalmus pectinirostris]|uniref:zona pellucida sperm-binding protein 4-like isoform X2 n=1 Tax=Boleophthalmus pectinirostris TaxID=150288 RepID=UPI002430DCD4|nr:zona pellucida sperm-binding protein 4-like isoform X2 [Boleophthalmus pectinirostris]
MTDLTCFSKPHPMSKIMLSCFKELCLIYFVFAFGANCFSIQKSKMHDRKKLALPKVTCSSERIIAVFGPHVNRNVTVEGPTGVVNFVSENGESCGVKLITDKNRGLVFLSKYDSCYTMYKDRKVVIPLRVQLKGKRRWYRVNISCPLIKRYSDKRTILSKTASALARECKTSKNLRMDCGHHESEDCFKLGCCYDDHDDMCFYRLNSCSLDRKFVFSVTTADTDYSTSLRSLMIKDHPECVPVITTPDTAVFKIGLMECGAKMKKDGNKVIYEIEVVDAIDSSFSLEVACEYEPSELKKAANLHALFLATNPPPAVALGSIGVQMRIAKDASFTSFFAEDELPVSLPLRENAHVEISFVEPSPDPTLSLRVRDCFAYPETKHSVWNLLFDGCPNPLDDMQSSIPVDNKGKIAFHSQVRRFDVKTFAFLDPHTGHHSTDPVYFYCWVEICSENVECAQYCSITSSGGERQRRDALHTSDHLHLISLGPLLAGQNGTDVEDNPFLKSKKMFQVTVYILAGVGAALLLLLMFMAFRSIRRCQMRAQTLDAQRNTEQSQ